VHAEHQDNLGYRERGGNVHRFSKRLASDAHSLGSQCRAWKEDSVDATLWFGVFVSVARAFAIQERER